MWNPVRAGYWKSGPRPWSRPCSDHGLDPGEATGRGLPGREKEEVVGPDRGRAVVLVWVAFFPSLKGKPEQDLLTTGLR